MFCFPWGGVAPLAKVTVEYLFYLWNWKKIPNHWRFVSLNNDVSFRFGTNDWMWKIGGNKIVDEKRIMMIPITFIPNPTLIKSIILTLPLENIIALGGVAKNEEGPN